MCATRWLTGSTDVIEELDVLYQTRIQAERFESRQDYELHRGVYIVDPALMRRLPEHAILMHPLPRVGEIDPAVDSDPRAAYFRQARNGVPVRMATLHWAMAALMLQTPRAKATILDADGVRRSLRRIAHEVIERQPGPRSPYLDRDRHPRCAAGEPAGGDA